MILFMGKYNGSVCQSLVDENNKDNWFGTVGQVILGICVDWHRPVKVNSQGGNYNRRVWGVRSKFTCQVPL